MYLLLFIFIFCIIYVSSFKEDFKAENIQKVSPILILGVALVLIVCILTSINK